ncbi:MAG: DEAD/DEAH box helicase [Verrucomicrobia bacterium]|nr:DEAD/DEAH box helicase [Verrucomicrobiota bacterium]
MSDRLFSDLGLSPELLKAVTRLGYEQATPIQFESIPPILEGLDVVGQSQTGSGKTAAFGLPALDRLQPEIREPQVLILCPTRELAVQVSEEIHKLAFFKKGVRALPVYGGQSYERQFEGLKAGAQIIIGTPGRLMDHLERGTLRLAGIRLVILDEADEMLNMGFRDDIEFLLGKTPKERQTVLFSATLPPAISELIRRHTRSPRWVRIEARALTVPTVEQVYFEVDRRWKIEALIRLIELHDVGRAIVFCNTQRMVDELTGHLNASGYRADALHGGMAQAARDRVMARFRKAALDLLVATDVAARGIDVEDIEVVFNFDLPYDAEDYVHRIGRTGRAGRSGIAISFVSGREVFAIRHIERFTRQRLRRGEVPSHGEIEEARLQQLMKRVRATIAAGDFRHYDHVIEALLEEGVDSLDLANALLHQLARGQEETAAREQPRPHAPPAGEPQGKTSESRPARPSSPSRRLPPPERPNVVPVPVPLPAPKAPVPVVRLPKPASRDATSRVDSVRIWMSIGASHGVGEPEIRQCIQGETGLAPDIVNAVDVRERHTFLQVLPEHAAALVSRLKRAQLGGRRLKVKLA